MAINIIRKEEEKLWMDTKASCRSFNLASIVAYTFNYEQRVHTLDPQMTHKKCQTITISAKGYPIHSFNYCLSSSFYGYLDCVIKGGPTQLCFFIHFLNIKQYPTMMVNIGLSVLGHDIFEWPSKP